MVTVNMDSLPNMNRSIINSTVFFCATANHITVEADSLLFLRTAQVKDGAADDVGDHGHQAEMNDQHVVQEHRRIQRVRVR